MKSKSSGSIFPPVPPPFRMPFYYASLSSLTLYYRVATETLMPFLKGTGLQPAQFDGGGAVSIEFQNYTGHGGTLLETVNEVECNILAYPTAFLPGVPQHMSLEDFIQGADQTKTIGGFRVYVPADNKFAVQAGREIFGEPKFLTTFSYNLPALNNPTQLTWEYSVLDPSYRPPKQGKLPDPRPKDTIYQVAADLRGLDPVPSNPSSTTLYCMLPGGKLVGNKGYKGRLIGSRWDVFSVYQAYFLNKRAQAKVTLTLGQSDHPMRVGMEELLGSSPVPAAARVYQSAPVAAEGGAFFVEGAGDDA